MNATEDKQRKAASLAEYVEVDTSDERVSRLWDRVSTELEASTLKRPRLEAGGFDAWGTRLSGRLVWGTLAVVTTVAAAIGTHTWWQNSQNSTSGGAVAGLEQATLETSSDSLAVDLRDGSRMELAAHSRLSVQKQERDELRLKLDQGKVDCDVAHNPSRQFYVQAAGVVVRVTGTRFSVDVRSEDAAAGTTARYVEVNVSRGSVEIQRIDGTMPARRLTAGERWAMRVSDGVTPAGSEIRGDSVDANRAGDNERGDNEREDGTNGPRSTGTRLEDNANSGAPVRAAKTTTPDEAEDARALLEKGRVARRQGNPKAAAAAYQKLLSQYPQDSRAGLAAFELGRLRMDRLGDLRGAVTALNQAVHLAPSTNVREDAMARLVDAYHRMGLDESCDSARQTYLAAFPAGVHAATVRVRCRP
jgi:ferric-dicitrate binding protein FerR (iron transport regulator)